MIQIRGFAPPNLSPSPVNHPCRRLRHNLDKKQSASLLIPSDLRCTGFGVYGRMPRSRFRLLQLTPRALLPDQGSLLRACSSRFKFSKGPLIVSAAARRHLLIFHAPVCSLMQLFDPGSIQGQSKHSVQTSRKCNFDLLFPNPKSAEITQQPRHGARVGGQPPAPLRCVPLGPASGSAISPSRRALCLRPPPYLSFFYRRSRGDDSSSTAALGAAIQEPWRGALASG